MIINSGMEKDTTPEVEKIVEEILGISQKYGCGLVAKLKISNILTTLTAKHEADKKKAVEDIIKMSDALELECGKDGDKGTKQWMAFKGFRNAVRDKHLTPTKTDKQTEV